MIRFLIVASRQDPAGMNIAAALQELKCKHKILLVNEDIIYADIPKTEQEYADYIIFASRHKAKDARKTLSVHFPGNWGKAELGGEDKQLNRVSAFFLKHAFQELVEQVKSTKLNYEVTLEATHHGPLVSKPCIFVEIGSTENEWKDKQAGEVMAKTILNTTKKFSGLKNEQNNWKVALAIGGGHYCPSFNKLELEDKYALSHICSKYFLADLDANMLKQVVEKTGEKVDLCLLDWKGLGQHKEKVLQALREADLEFERV